MIITAREDTDVGGLNNSYLNEGNHIIIRNDDGSTAMYWHLQKDGVAVNVRDSVTKG